MKKKEKQWLSIALSAAMVVTGIPATGIGMTVQAATGEAQVSVKNGEVTIGNEYLERKFSTSDNKLATTELDNKRADLTFTPAQGSEEFIIKLRQDGTTKLDGELDRTNWTVTASDQYNNEVGAKDGPGANVIDGDASTRANRKLPHFLISHARTVPQTVISKDINCMWETVKQIWKVMQTLRQKVILLTMTEKRFISI